jgi:hypothetical protein
VAFYNFQRTHQGYRGAGRTPAKARYDLIGSQWLLPPISDAAEEASRQLTHQHPEEPGAGEILDLYTRVLNVDPARPTWFPEASYVYVSVSAPLPSVRKAALPWASYP